MKMLDYIHHTHLDMHILTFYTARRSVLEMVDDAQEELGDRMVATTKLMMRTAAPLINTLVPTHDACLARILNLEPPNPKPQTLNPKP